MAFRIKQGLFPIILFLFLSEQGSSQNLDGETQSRAKVDVPENIEKTLKDLETVFKGVKTVQTDFIQEKRLAVFKQTIVLEGTIVLENPGRLAWHTDKPFRYALVISGDQIQQWDEDSGEVQKISLSSNPIFKVVSEQLQYWFRGNYLSLAEEYTIEMLKEEPVIVLTFTPRKDSLAIKNIKKVTVTFRKDKHYVKEIIIEDRSGDCTTMTFKNTVLNKPIDAKMWEVKQRV